MPQTVLPEPPLRALFSAQSIGPLPVFSLLARVFRRQAPRQAIPLLEVSSLFAECLSTCRRTPSSATSLVLRSQHFFCVFAVQNKDSSIQAISPWNPISLYAPFQLLKTACRQWSYPPIYQREQVPFLEVGKSFAPCLPLLGSWLL